MVFVKNLEVIMLNDLNFKKKIFMNSFFNCIEVKDNLFWWKLD